MRKFIMSMVALGFLAAPVLMLQGCGNITGDTAYNDNSGQEIDNSYTFNEGDRDYGSGTVLVCDDANCSVMVDESGRTITNADDEADAGDAVIGEYSDAYSPAECNAAGFFYCTIEDKCLNQRVDDSSSSCSK